MSWLSKTFKKHGWVLGGLNPFFFLPQYRKGAADQYGKIVGEVTGKSPDGLTTTYGFDPQTQAYIKAIMDAQMAGANQPGGVDPQTQAAIDAFSQYSNLGLTGANALSGNAQAQGQFFNPYQQEVVDRVTGDYGRLNDMAQQGINDYYTRAGSFGGSRQAISSGQASADIARGLGDTVAGLRYTGFNDAMQRAYQSANLGFGATGALPSLGQYAQTMNDPNLRKAAILQRGFQGLPYGQTVTQPVSQGSPFGNLLGWWMLTQGLGGGGGAGAVGSRIPSGSFLSNWDPRSLG